jgi:hypothetical protein
VGEGGGPWELEREEWEKVKESTIDEFIFFDTFYNYRRLKIVPLAIHKS